MATAEAKKDRKEDMTKWNHFVNAPKFTGDELEFSNFEFKLQYVVRSEKEFEHYLDWVKELEKEPNRALGLPLLPSIVKRE